MPLVPNLLEHAMFFTFNQGPGVALDLWGGIASRLVLAALRLNVFETLQSGPLTAAQVAEQHQADVAGIRILLDALEPLGYVEKRGAQYRNSAMTRKWLLNSGEINFTGYFRFWGAVMEKLWPQLEDSLRSGQPPVNMYEWIEHEPEVSRNFQDGMVAIARYISGDVARTLTLPPGAKRLLDVGGGHAAYSLAICKAYPELSAIVLDSPQALVTGRQMITAENMGSHVNVQEGNFLTEELGQDFDVALIFNIIHGFSPEQNIALFQKVARALNPGGMIAILEQLPDSSPLPLGKASVHILSASYFHLLGGQIYDYQSIAGWLSNAGFGGLQRKNLLRGSSTLIMATKS